MNKWIEILIGLIFVIAAVLIGFLTLPYGFWDFGHAAWEFFKGGILWFILMIGLLFLMLGISNLRE